MGWELEVAKLRASWQITVGGERYCVHCGADETNMSREEHRANCDNWRTEILDVLKPANMVGEYVSCCPHCGVWLPKEGAWFYPHEIGGTFCDMAHKARSLERQGFYTGSVPSNRLAVYSHYVPIHYGVTMQRSYGYWSLSPSTRKTHKLYIYEQALSYWSPVPFIPKETADVFNYFLGMDGFGYTLKELENPDRLVKSKGRKRTLADMLLAWWPRDKRDAGIALRATKLVKRADLLFMLDDWPDLSEQTLKEIEGYKIYNELRK